MQSKKIEIVKDVAGKTILVTRIFNAPANTVWKAWTDSHILDQWWAPKPWKAETKSMDFSVGGHWLYAMVSPEGAKHWSRIDYREIDAPTSFTVDNYFCDESGTKNEAMPTMLWNNNFAAIDGGTRVIVKISFNKETDMKTIVEMGFEGGFTMGLNNLEEYLAAQ